MGGIPHKHFPNTGLGETNGLGLLICKKEPFACISLKFVRCPDGSTPNTFKVSVSERAPFGWQSATLGWPSTVSKECGLQQELWGSPQQARCPGLDATGLAGASSFLLRIFESLGAAKFCSVWINNAPTFGVSSVSLHLFIDQKSWLCRSLILLTISKCLAKGLDSFTAPEFSPMSGKFRSWSLGWRKTSTQSADTKCRLGFPYIGWPWLKILRYF